MAGSLKGIVATISGDTGAYALCLRVEEEQAIQVGRLGVVSFPEGVYYYCGSARGPGGLRARLKHHILGTVKPHWHIDYVRGHARLKAVWYTTAPERLECAWSQALAGLAGASIAAKGFGSSDCRSGCQAHLIAFPGRLAVLDVYKCLLAASQGHFVSAIEKIE